MSGRGEKARSIVLTSRPLGEADRILRLFTRELGRVDAVVKGVRKTSSRWGGRLEPFNVCDLLLHPGRSLYTVTQAQLVDVFLHLREDREALTAAAVVCETAAGLTPEHQPEERLFALLRNTLAELDRGFAGPAAEAPLVLGAMLKLLHEAGYAPILDHCAACGGGDRALGFSASHGGLVCPTCLGDGLPVTPEAVAAMCSALETPLAELRVAAPSAATGEALRDVHELYAYHAGSRLRALRFARAAR
jgi:DNA repair protein RecO (recombination protein O)